MAETSQPPRPPPWTDWLLVTTPAWRDWADCWRSSRTVWPSSSVIWHHWPSDTCQAWPGETRGGEGAHVDSFIDILYHSAWCQHFLWKIVEKNYLARYCHNRDWHWTIQHSTFGLVLSFINQLILFVYLVNLENFVYLILSWLTKCKFICYLCSKCPL